MTSQFPDRSNEVFLALLSGLGGNPGPSVRADIPRLFGPSLVPRPQTPTFDLLSLFSAIEKPLPPLPQRQFPAIRPVPLPTTRRKVFFSFHYSDVMRVNNVRHSEQFKAKALEVPQSFYDRSLWESRRLTNPEALKEMIRDGVKNSSVICVLIGTDTWQRRWVRYEIARAVIDGKGLVGVHLNSLRHHTDRIPHPRGPDPLEFMGVGKMQDGTYRLFEGGPYQWRPYSDYAGEVRLPRYILPPAIGQVTPLARGVVSYDYALQNGSNNLPLWLDQAAGRMGR